MLLVRAAQDRGLAQVHIVALGTLQVAQVVGILLLLGDSLLLLGDSLLLGDILPVGILQVVDTALVDMLLDLDSLVAGIPVGVVAHLDKELEDNPVVDGLVLDGQYMVEVVVEGMVEQYL